MRRSGWRVAVAGMVATMGTDARTLYLDLLERCLTRTGFQPPYQRAGPPRGTLRAKAFRLVRSALPPSYEIVRRASVEAQQGGHIWPADAETMIGLARLRNIRDLVLSALERGVSGDLLEAGVWRGGAAIYMRAVLKAYAVEDRSVWVADSFRGLPPPEHPADTIDWSRFSQLAVPADEVRTNFERYGLLDDRVRFIEGFFSDTLRTSPVHGLALLRIDADMYSSTMDVLTALYAKVSSGGFVIVDDYGAVDACRQAVDRFRSERHVAAPLERIDTSGVYWKVE